MIREFLYLQKSDRKVILTLLAVIVVALGVIFLTGGESDQDYLKLFGELKELGVRDMTEEGSAEAEPQAEDQEMLARERISLKLNGEEIKGSLSLSQGNAGRYIYLEFAEPLVLTAGDELILTVR